MQNRFQTLFLAAACLAVVGVVGWQAGASSTETRVYAQPTAVAIVNVEKALNELKELKTRNADLEARVKNRQAELDSLNSQLEKLSADLEQLPTDAQERRREVRAKIFEVRETAKARASAYQSLINIEKGEIIRPLYIKLQAAIEEIAQKQGYDLVLFDDRGIQIPNEVDRVVNQAIQEKRVLFAADSLDITDQIILLLNSKFDAGVN